MSKNKKVFGESIQYDTTDLPEFVIDAISYLRNNALKIEGIFRINGDSNQINAIKKKIDQGKKVNFSKIQDINVVAGLLKLYFRSLPEPLFTYETYDMFMAGTIFHVYQAQCVPDSDQRLVMIKKVLSFLPPTNFRLLKLICKLLFHILGNFLYEITLNYDENKMNSTNLAICFAPNLLRANTQDLKLIMSDQNNGKELMVSLIDRYKYFFEGEDINKRNQKMQTKVVLSKENIQKMEKEIEDFEKSPKSFIIKESNNDKVQLTIPQRKPTQLPPIPPQKNSK